ncbi:unnamed protein product [Prorocentrum cordatum]|uniref:RING-type domain-containing protein n=1 Tax=Prorocentrum cordatum TaxID=2364126 RepID=A0ABN9UR68_9DINO|nr:unnamed protein product [Polarella glacialis]
MGGLQKRKGVGILYSPSSEPAPFAITFFKRNVANMAITKINKLIEAQGGDPTGNTVWQTSAHDEDATQGPPNWGAAMKSHPIHDQPNTLTLSDTSTEPTHPGSPPAAPALQQHEARYSANPISMLDRLAAELGQFSPQRLNADTYPWLATAASTPKQVLAPNRRMVAEASTTTLADDIDDTSHHPLTAEDVAQLGGRELDNAKNQSTDEASTMDVAIPLGAEPVLLDDAATLLQALGGGPGRRAGPEVLCVEAPRGQDAPRPRCAERFELVRNTAHSRGSPGASELTIPIAKTATLAALKAQAAAALGLDPGGLHLSRGPKGPQLKNEAQTLRASGIAELFSHCAKAASSVRGLRQAILEPLARWASEQEQPPFAPDGLQWRRLRLRDGHAGKQFAILRDDRTLRGALLGLADGRHVAVQVLDQDEELTPDDLVVSVRAWRYAEGRLSAAAEVVVRRSQALSELRGLLDARYHALLTKPDAEASAGEDAGEDRLEVVALASAGPPLTVKRCATLRWGESQLNATDSDSPGAPLPRSLRSLRRPLAELRDLRDGATLVVRSARAAARGPPGEPARPAGAPPAAAARAKAKARRQQWVRGRGRSSQERPRARESGVPDGVARHQNKIRAAGAAPAERAAGLSAAGRAAGGAPPSRLERLPSSGEGKSTAEAQATGAGSSPSVVVAGCRPGRERALVIEARAASEPGDVPPVTAEATRASKRLDRRAPPGFISRITTVPYDPELFGTEDGRQYHGECPICLGEFGAADEIKVPLCGHAFHKDCLARWLRKERTCALCRQDVTQAPEAGAEGAGLGATAAGRGVGVPEETAALGAATPAHPGAAGVQAAVLGRSSSADGAAASNPTHDAEI